MSKELAAVRNLYFDLLGKWNSRDAHGMASLFSSEGGQVGFDGSTANGPDDIQAHLKPIFSDHPTARFIGKVRDVRLVGDDTALLRAVAGMVPPGEDHIKAERNAVQTLVASKIAGGRWMVEMFHNTPAAFHGRPDETKRLTEELEAELSSVGG